MFIWAHLAGDARRDWSEVDFGTGQSAALWAGGPFAQPIGAQQAVSPAVTWLQALGQQTHLLHRQSGPAGSERGGLNILRYFRQPPLCSAAKLRWRRGPHTSQFKFHKIHSWPSHVSCVWWHNISQTKWGSEERIRADFSRTQEFRGRTEKPQLAPALFAPVSLNFWWNRLEGCKRFSKKCYGLLSTPELHNVGGLMSSNMLFPCLDRNYWNHLTCIQLRSIILPPT